MIVFLRYFLISVIVSNLVVSSTDFVNPSQEFELGKVCVMSTCFDVEVADRPLLRSLGLMGRQSLAKKSGMWFVFDHLGKYTFWMKNTHIPLDILFINENFEIVDMFLNAPPCLKDPCSLYTSKKNAKFALELNAGTVRAYGISVGDTAYYTKLSTIKVE